MSGRGVNNSSILFGDKQHVIVVDKNNAKLVKEYADTLGITSLHNALEVLINTDKSSITQKAKAVEDLILIRLILSGDIQFKEKGLFGLMQNVIGNKFKKFPKDKGGNVVRQLIEDLDSGKNDVSVIKHFFIKLIFIFGTTTVFSLMVSTPIIAGTISNPYTNPTARESGIIRKTIKNLYAELTDITHDSERYNMVLTEIADLKSKLNNMPTGSEELFDFLITNIGIAYPILIGLLVSMLTARKMVNWENNIYTTAIVRLIDRFLLTNEYIYDIINDPKYGFDVPKPLVDDQLGMALYFSYIKHINTQGQNTRVQVIRNDIDKETGTPVINMSIFGRLNKALDDCGICLNPLGTAGMSTPVEVCDNHHMFHMECIKKWIKGGKNLCPNCRKPILPSITEMRGGRKRRTRRTKKKTPTRKVIW
jgi:hypothetical protein